MKGKDKTLTRHLKSTYLCKLVIKEMDIHSSGELKLPAKFWGEFFKKKHLHECAYKSIRSSITVQLNGPTLKLHGKNLKPGFASCKHDTG
jgi:hypothetical protein